MISGDHFFISSMYNFLGIRLDPSGLHHSHARLRSIMARLNMSTLDELMHKLNAADDEQLARDTIEAITNHETFFMREPQIFQLITGTVIPPLLLKRKTGKIRIWSAACSTGQEPYSLAMCLAGAFPRDLSRFEIIATDICKNSLAAAAEGSYTRYQVDRGLDAQLLESYLAPDTRGRFKINDKIRSLITFKQANLMTATFREEFDVILCRNVSIYFTEEKKRKLYANLEAAASPGCILLTGTTESSTAYLPSATPVFAAGTKYYIISKTTKEKENAT